MRLLKVLFIAVFILSSTLSFSQDFDVYHRKKDDGLKIPEVYENMFLDEYQLLSRDIRMMDMAYSAILPGYVHFKAKENILGYTVLGFRMIGFAGLYANYYRMKNYDTRIWELANGNSSYKTDQAIFISSIAIIASSYLFDWIHGKFRLERKQELIKYKYGMKLKLEKRISANESHSFFPALSLNFKF